MKGNKEGTRREQGGNKEGTRREQGENKEGTRRERGAVLPRDYYDATINLPLPYAICSFVNIPITIFSISELPKTLKTNLSAGGLKRLILGGLGWSVFGPGMN